VQYLSHSASFQALEKYAPPNDGTKHLDFCSCFLVVIPEGDLLFRCTLDEWTSTERLSVLNSGDALRKTISRLCLKVDRRRVRDRDLLDRSKFGNLSI